MILFKKGESARLMSWLSNQKQLSSTPNDEVSFQLRKVYYKHINIVKELIIPELCNIVSEYLEDEINVRMLIYECGLNEEADGEVNRYFDIKYQIYDTKINDKAYEVHAKHNLIYNEETTTLDYTLTSFKTKDGKIFKPVVDQTNDVCDEWSDTEDIHEEWSDIDEDIRSDGFSNHFAILRAEPKIRNEMDEYGYGVYCNCEPYDVNYLVLFNHFMKRHYGKTDYIDIPFFETMHKTTVSETNSTCKYQIHLGNRSITCKILDKVRMKNIIVIEKIILNKVINLLKWQFANNNFAKKLVIE